MRKKLELDEDIAKEVAVNLLCLTIGIVVGLYLRYGLK